MRLGRISAASGAPTPAPAVRGGRLGQLVALAARATEPREVLRDVGIAGSAVGLAFAAAPRLGLRVMGLEAEGRGVSLLARLFASRDLAVGLAMLRASRRPRLDMQWLELIAVFQVGDLAFSGALYRTGHLSRRGWAIVLLTATPTLVVASVARARAGHEAGAHA